MKERINWIDWVKAICMTGVVFIHLPQQENGFIPQFVGAVTLSPFFFVSGYMKRLLSSPGECFAKYGRSLLIPYIIYNVLFFPYWYVKFFVEHGALPAFADCLKPVAGTLLFQLNTDFSTELNGVTWFLVSLFLMHFITDFFHGRKRGNAMMVLLTIVCVLLYGANKYYHFAPYITVHGFVRCWCFYYMGILLRQKGLRSYSSRRNLLAGILFLGLSIAFFEWHIHEACFVTHICLYYVVNILFVIGVLYLCMAIDNFRLRSVTSISIGKMVIFGLHRILIGCIDFLFAQILHLTNISYAWYTAVLIAIVIECLLLPVIWASRTYFPILLGKKSSSDM